MYRKNTKKLNILYKISPNCENCGIKTIRAIGCKVCDNTATIQHNKFKYEDGYEEDISLWCNKCNQHDNCIKMNIINANLSDNQIKKNIANNKYVLLGLHYNTINKYEKLKLYDGYYLIDTTLYQIKSREIINTKCVFEFKLNLLYEWIKLKIDDIKYNKTFDKYCVEMIKIIK